MGKVFVINVRIRVGNLVFIEKFDGYRGLVIISYLGCRNGIFGGKLVS